VRQVEIGQKARLRFPASPKVVFQGRVISVSSTPTTSALNRADVSKVQYKVVVSVEALYSENLAEGMTASVEIIAVEHADVLVIPIAALIEKDGNPKVEVVNGGRVITVRLTPGARNSHLVEVKEGLQEGDMVRVNRANRRNLYK